MVCSEHEWSPDFGAAYSTSFAFFFYVRCLGLTGGEKDKRGRTALFEKLLFFVAEIEVETSPGSYE